MLIFFLVCLLFSVSVVVFGEIQIQQNKITRRLDRIEKLIQLLNEKKRE